jgi:E3 ubiquitin-protein ligase BRE1
VSRAATSWCNFLTIDYCSAAENRTSALEQSLAGLDHDHPDITRHIKSEVEAQQKLAEVTAELERYRKIYGDSPLPLDLSRLAEKLKRKDDELQQLRLVKEQQSQVWMSIRSWRSIEPTSS